MAAWMVYVTGVGAVVGAAAVLLERGLHRLGRPVRWVWLAALTGTGSIPVAALIFGTGEAGWSVPAVAVPAAAETVFVVGWVTATLMLLANLRLSAWTLRRNRRAWRDARVDGHRAVVSAGFGPGVIGVARPRIVLPEWVLESDPSVRRLVLAHEAEHVRAGDTRLLLAGLLLASLVPWCLPAWWQLHRLRAAMETDCDARVLRGPAGRREYANALVAVAGRSRTGLPVPALAPRRAELERRIRIITSSGPRSRAATLGLFVGAVALALGLARVPAPPPPSMPALPAFRLANPLLSSDAPRRATVILSVQPETRDAR